MPNRTAARPVVRIVHDTTVVHDALIVRDTIAVNDTVAVHDRVQVTGAASPQSPMTLDGVVALLGLLLAIFALAGPAQRRSLMILLPPRRMVVWLGVAILLVLLPNLVRMIGREPYPVIALGLPILSFGVAIAVTVFGIVTWGRGTLPNSALGRLEELALVSLNEGNFDEVGRLMTRNIVALRKAPEGTLVALFDPKLVGAMVERRNYAHLELIGDESAFGQREAALTGVDIVSRALLHADPSPLTSVIVKALGGDEWHAALVSEEALADRTFGNWRWYTASRAAQSITVVAHEALMTGDFDVPYNLASFHYLTPNGTSGRIKCPAYRAIALHYLALKDAQRHGFIEGADPMDFFSVFKAAFVRSKATGAWNEPNVPSDTPTPFAYLMNQTMCFLQLLARDGYAHAVGDRRFRDEDGIDIPVSPKAKEVFRRTCETWALCLWFVTTETGRVPVRFIVSAIREYLNEALQFGFERSRTSERTAYATIAVEEFERRVSEPRLSELAKVAFESLDTGKGHVNAGRDWLRDRLGPTASWS